MDSRRKSSALHLAQVAVDKWELVQVELQGKYSLERMGAFYAYSIQTRWCRILLWSIITPIPSLMVNILLDVPPLALPSAGRDANYVFWTRLMISTVIVAYWLWMQTGFMTSGLGMTRRHAFTTSIIVATACTIYTYILAGIITMPVPFLLISSSPAFAMTTAIMVVFYFGRRLKNEARLLASFNRAGGIVWLQLFLTFIYPAFIYGFNSIPSKYQTPYMILIPVIKLIAKNIMSRLVGSNDDMKSVEIIFNVDCFNAIYVSLAMQHATTVSTSLIVMLTDAVQGCVSVYDVYQRYQPLKRFINDLPADHPLYGKNFLEVAIALDQNGSLKPHGGQTFIKTNKNPTLLISPSPQNTRTSGKRTSTKVFVANSQANRGAICIQSNECSSETRSAFLHATRKLLFTTEFVILVEYTEVIMPVFYSLLMAATYYLPNRTFYSTIADIDEHELWSMIINVLMYATLELASLVVIDFVLRRITGVSAMGQVGFVLESQCTIVQSKLLSWVLYAVQNSLEHYGADFSFQFKWLHSK